MDIIYTCPECGNDLEDTVLTTYPPKYEKRCLKCGWSYTEGSDGRTLRIPFQPFHATRPLDSSNVPQACRGCLNHPINGGSGICHCTLVGVHITS